MPGSAILGGNLVDSLLPMVDDIRGSLNPAMGVRQFRVFIERVRWDGGARGTGAPHLTSAEIDPQPQFVEPNGTQALHFAQTPAGRLEEGDAQLLEVSLTYTNDELTGGAIAEDTEFRYRVSDAQGQGIPDRFYVPAAPPFPDREKTIGWRIDLKRCEPLG